MTQAPAFLHRGWCSYSDVTKVFFLVRVLVKCVRNVQGPYSMAVTCPWCRACFDVNSCVGNIFCVS